MIAVEDRVLLDRAVTPQQASGLGLVYARNLTQIRRVVGAGALLNMYWRAPGWLIPWTSPLDGDRVWQFRPKNPVWNSDEDRFEKYVFPNQARNRFNALKVVPDCDRVLVVEGTFQSIACALNAPDGWSVYGMAGCWGWRYTDKQTGVKGSIPDTAVLAGKHVVISLDADVRSNEGVELAATKLTEHLSEIGAKSVLFMDSGGTGKQGPDDILAGLDPSDRPPALARMIDSAVPVHQLLALAPPSHLDDDHLSVDSDRDDDDELAEQATSSIVPSIHFTDAGQASWLRSRLPIIYASGAGWFGWNGKMWCSLDEGDISDRARKLLEDEFAHWTKKYATSRQDQHLAMAAGIKKYLNSGTLKGAVVMLRGMVKVDASQLDNDRGYLNCDNGVVELATGRLLKHEDCRGMFITKIAGGRYRPKFRHPDWDKVLQALDEQTARWLQIRMGAAITGDTALAEDVVFLQGGGSNGKSVMVNDGVYRALGGYASRRPSEILASRVGASSGSASPEMAALRGSRLVLVEELPEEFALSTNALKQLSGTGTITARELYKDPITFDTTHSLFVNTNHLPNVLETDWGTWRRLTLVPFTKRFTLHPDPDDPDELPRDPDLALRLRAGLSDQRDAIIAWLCAGAKLAIENPSVLAPGMSAADDGRCQVVREATYRWRGEVDKLYEYFNEFLATDPAGCVLKNDFVWHFNKYLVDSGAKPWSAKLIKDRMTNHVKYRGIEEKNVRPASAVGVTRPPVKVERFSAGDDLPPVGTVARALVGIRYDEKGPDE